MMDDDLPEHLEELAWLLGQYDDDDEDMDVLWPDIEARATSALQVKIAEKRKQDTYRFLVNPVRTLVKESWTKSFRESVNNFRADRRKEEENAQAKAKMDAISPKVGLKQFLMQKLGMSAKPDEGASPAKKKNHILMNLSPNKSPNKQGKQLKKPPTHLLLKSDRKSAEEVGKSSSVKRVQNQVVNRPRGKTLKKKLPPSFKKDSEEEDSSSATEDESSDEELGPTKRRGGVVKKSPLQRSPSKSPRADFTSNAHQKQGIDSLSDEEYCSEGDDDEDTEEELSEEDDGEEDETRAETYNLLNLPSAPKNLPKIYCELSLMLAELPGGINWDILAKRASPELRDMILQKKSRDEIAFRNSPYNQLVPLQVYDSFQWYRMALRKAVAQPLAPLTAQIEGGPPSRNLTAGNYSIVFDKQTFMSDPTKAPRAAVSVRKPASAVHPVATNKVAQPAIPFQKAASSTTVQRAAEAAPATTGRNAYPSSGQRGKKAPTSTIHVHKKSLPSPPAAAKKAPISTLPVQKAAPPGKKALPAVPVQKAALSSVHPATKAPAAVPVRKTKQKKGSVFYAAAMGTVPSSKKTGKKAMLASHVQNASATPQPTSKALPVVPLRTAPPSSQSTTKTPPAALPQKASTSTEPPKEQPAVLTITPQPSLKRTASIPSVDMPPSPTKHGKESSVQPGKKASTSAVPPQWTSSASHSAAAAKKAPISTVPLQKADPSSQLGKKALPAGPVQKVAPPSVQAAKKVPSVVPVRKTAPSSVQPRKKATIAPPLAATTQPTTKALSAAPVLKESPFSQSTTKAPPTAPVQQAKKAPTSAVPAQNNSILSHPTAAKKAPTSTVPLQKAASPGKKSLPAVPVQKVAPSRVQPAKKVPSAVPVRKAAPPSVQSEKKAAPAAPLAATTQPTTKALSAAPLPKESLFSQSRTKTPPAALVQQGKKASTSAVPAQNKSILSHPTATKKAPISAVPLQKAATPGKKALPAVPVQKIAPSSVQPAKKVPSAVPVRKAAPPSVQQKATIAPPLAATTQPTTKALSAAPVLKEPPFSQSTTKVPPAAPVQQGKKAPTSAVPAQNNSILSHPTAAKKAPTSTVPLQKAASPGKKALPAVPVQKVAPSRVQPAPKAVPVVPVQKAAPSSVQPATKVPSTAPVQNASATTKPTTKALQAVPVRNAPPTSQPITKAPPAAPVQTPTRIEPSKEQPALPTIRPQPSLKRTASVASVDMSPSPTKHGKESSSESPAPTKTGKAAPSASKEAIKKTPSPPKPAEMKATSIEKSPASPKTRKAPAASVEMPLPPTSMSKSSAFNNQYRDLHVANATEWVEKPPPTTDAMESPPGTVSPSRPPTSTKAESEDEKKEDGKDNMETLAKRKADGAVFRDDDDDDYDDDADDDEAVGEDDDEYRASDGEDHDEDNESVSDEPKSPRNKEKRTKDRKSKFSGTNDRPEKADQSSIGKNGDAADDEDYELDNKNPLAVLTPELHELAELLGKQRHPFDWQWIEKSGSEQLKVFFAAKRKKFENFDRNRGGYLIRTQQRSNFRRLRRKVIRRCKGTPCVDRNLTLKHFRQQKRVSAMKRISVPDDVDESSLTGEQRELARVLALQKSENNIDWDLVKSKASPALNRLIESEEQHEDFKNDPLRFLVGVANYSTFKKVRSCFSTAGGPKVVNVGDTGDITPVIPKVPGLEQWTPVQREFALILAELRISGKDRLAGNKAHDWQYIFKAASPTLRSVLDAKSQEYPSFFRAPGRFLVSHNDEDVARFLELRKLFEKALAKDKDRLIAKAKAFAPKIKKGPRMSEEEIDEALEGLEDLPRFFVEFGEILEDIKEQHIDHHYATVYDWDYINSVASEPLRKHVAKKRALKCFERSKMNALIGTKRHLPFKSLRLKIRRFRNQSARRSSRGHGLTRSWEHARFENEDESESSAKAAHPEAESSPDLEPFLPGMTRLIEPEIQLARVLEEIKFLRPTDNSQTIWDMDYILSHAPGRLRRYLERKIRLNDKWAGHKLRVFVRLDRTSEFKEMRQRIKVLLKEGKIKPLTYQNKQEEDVTLPEKSDASIEGTSDRKKSGKTAQPQNNEDEEDELSSAADDSDSGNDSDQSYTDEEEMVTLRNSSRGIKLTSSLKELAIYWELFNDRGQGSQPDWDKVEKHVSPSLRRLIREKRQLRIFKDDPSLLLVFPDLRANFDRVRAEVRRDPDFYISHLPKAVAVKKNLDKKKGRKRSLQTKDTAAPTKARRVIVDNDDDDDFAVVLQTGNKKTRKRKRIVDDDDDDESAIASEKGGKRSLVGRKQPPSKTRKRIVDDDDSDDDHNNAVAALKDDNNEKYHPSKDKVVMFITRIQMKELARLMAHATQRKEGWAFVEARASGPLKALMENAAAKDPADYMDGPTRCLVPPNLWSEFAQMRERAAKKKYKDDDDVDSDYDFGKKKKPKKRRKSSASASNIVENQRELLEAFSKKMREQLMEFEANQQELISQLNDEE